MGLFDKLFGKKQIVGDSKDPAGAAIKTLEAGDTFVSTGDQYGFKITRTLTPEQKERIAKSTILLRTGQLYMHYWTDNIVPADRNDPQWQNKVMFFWKAEEPFPSKSLPPEFETYQIRYFLFTGVRAKVTLQVGQATPWFGMPGLGEKHVCEKDGEKITVPELSSLNLVEYVETVELNDGNLEVLTDKEDYFFLVDERVTVFENGNFYLKGKPIPIDLAYSIGGIHLIKKTAPDN